MRTRRIRLLTATVLTLATLVAPPAGATIFFPAGTHNITTDQGDSTHFFDNTVVNVLPGGRFGDGTFVGPWGAGLSADTAVLNVQGGEVVGSNTEDGNGPPGMLGNGNMGAFALAGQINMSSGTIRGGAIPGSSNSAGAGVFLNVTGQLMMTGGTVSGGDGDSTSRANGLITHGDASFDVSGGTLRGGVEPGGDQGRSIEMRGDSTGVVGGAVLEGGISVRDNARLDLLAGTTVSGADASIGVQDNALVRISGGVFDLEALTITGEGRVEWSGGLLQTPLIALQPLSMLTIFGTNLAYDCVINTSGHCDGTLTGMLADGTVLDHRLLLTSDFDAQGLIPPNLGALVFSAPATAAAPGTMALLMIGAFGLLARRRARRVR